MTQSSIRSIQAPPAVVTVRPHRFTSNPETAQDNSFQSVVVDTDKDAAASVAQAAYDEVTIAAMVLDHLARVAYTAKSNRANAVALESFCTHFNYEPMVFGTADAAGRAVYHTNVLMCIATEFTLVGFELIDDLARAAKVRARLEESGRTLIALSNQQIADFTGNAMELTGNNLGQS